MPLFKYVIAIALLLVLYVSYVGWGTLFARLIRSASEQYWSLMAAFGVAVTVAIGGCLNLAGLANRGALICITIAGVALFLVLRRQSVIHAASEWTRKRPTNIQFLAGCGVLYVLLAAVSQEPGWDDIQHYLLFPVKMLATGSLNPDPFSFLRAIAGLGGQQFLQAQFLSLSSPRTVQGLDHGLGVLAFVALVMVQSRHWAVPRRGVVAIAALLGLLAFGMAGHKNATSVALAATLMLAILICYELRAQIFPARWSEILTMGMLIAALASLKSSNIPHAAIVVAALYLTDQTRLVRERVAAFVGIGLLSLAVMTPWMIGSYLNSGTLLYPIFGAGHVVSSTAMVVGSDMMDWKAQIIALGEVFHPLVIAPLILALMGASNLRTDPWQRRMLAVAIAGLLASLIGFLVMGLLRYLLSLQYAIFGYIATAQLTRSAPAGVRDEQRTIMNLGVLFLTLGLTIGGTWEEIGRALYNPRNLARREFKDPAGIRRGQRRVLPNEPIVVFGSREPFWFDFQRNRVFLWDYPGSMSPPPGLPSLDGDPEELARISHHDGA